MKKEHFSGYRVAIASFLVMFFNLGLLGSTGVFIPHIASALNVQPTDIGLMVTFATGGAFLFSMTTQGLIKKISAKKTLILATVINGLHFSIFAFSSAPWMIYFAALLGGAVLAYGSNVVCSTIISNWFIEKRASVIGLVFGGAGFGSAFALFAAGQMIHIVGWRNTYLMFSAILIAIGLPLIIFFITEKPESLNQKPLGWDNAQASNAKQEHAEVSGMTLKEARQTPTYWIWLVGILLTGMLITGVVTYVPSYWQSFGMDAVVSSNYTSLISLLGAGLTLLSGVIADKFGVGAYLSYTMGSYLIGAILLVTFPIPNAMTALSIVVLLALAYPSSTNYPATITTVAFGSKEYTGINANFQTMVYLSKAALPILILNLTKLGVTLQQAYMVQIVFGLIGFVLLISGLLLIKNRKQAIGKEEPNV